jgi:serine protease AprX
MATWRLRRDSGRVRLLRGLVGTLVLAGSVAVATPGGATGDAPALVALAGLAAPPDATMVAALEATGLSVVPLRHVPAAVVVGTPEALGAAAALPGVLRVDVDRPLELYLDRTVAQIGAASVRDELGIDGSGVTVAVVDSGIDATHPDLAFGTKVVQNVKILGEEHYAPGVSLTVEGMADTDTTSGHGTHVAGIVAGDGTASAGRYRGVAPGARLVGVGSGEGVSMVTAAVGLDWVIENRDRYGIRVVNNSWGDGSVPYDPDDTLNRATRAVHDAGIVVVMAAGNDGAHGAGHISRYCVPDWVVCVGASTKTGALASLSSWGDPADPSWWPDVLAPGMWVASARAATGTVSDANSVPMDLTDPADPRVMPVELWGHYTVLSGTSMAAPHVAGVVALMLEANPRLTPDAVREVLRRTARPIDGCPPHACGAGQVDARAAVDLVRSVKNVRKFTSKRWGWEFWGVERVTSWTGSVPASLFGTAHDLRLLDVPPDADSLDVTVSWSSALADLDLTLRRPDGTTAATATGSLSQVGTDRAEVALVGGPVAGTWTVDVAGFVSAGQPYTATASIVTPL